MIWPSYVSPLTGDQMPPPNRTSLLSQLALLFLGWMLIDPTGTAPPLHAETLAQADEVLVIKHERKLYLMRQNEPLKWFWIALGRNPVGQKTEIGDGRTPEGVYRIEGRDLHDDFYRALWLSYPNSADRERAQRLGVNPGGGIMIHAVPKGYEPTGAGKRMIDWTDGCIAVTNTDMDEIWARVPDGTQVEIRP
jgi:murein L,D-transpeptidase YafK